MVAGLVPLAISLLSLAGAFGSANAAECDLKKMSIQQLIEFGESKTVAKRIVGSDAVPLLTEGFTFQEVDRVEASRKSAERLDDPDVVAFRSIATAALTPGQSRKLASVMWLAVYPYGGSTLQEALKLQNDLNDDLSDTELMEQILAADPAVSFLPENGRRKLLCDGCSPANSYVCSNCWPNKVCAKYYWCR